jgi:hypothetical protein
MYTMLLLGSSIAIFFKPKEDEAKKNFLKANWLSTSTDCRIWHG